MLPLPERRWLAEKPAEWLLPEGRLALPLEELF
jgi:hypothetical protein